MRLEQVLLERLKAHLRNNFAWQNLQNLTQESEAFGEDSQPRQEADYLPEPRSEVPATGRRDCECELIDESCVLVGPCREAVREKERKKERERREREKKKERRHTQNSPVLAAVKRERVLCGREALQDSVAASPHAAPARFLGSSSIPRCQCSSRALACSVLHNAPPPKRST